MKDHLLAMLLVSVSATAAYGQDRCGARQPVPKVIELGRGTVGPMTPGQQSINDWVAANGLYTYSANALDCRLSETNAVIGSIDTKLESIAADQRNVDQALLKRQENAEASLASQNTEKEVELSARIETLEKQLAKLQAQFAGDAGIP